MPRTRLLLALLVAALAVVLAACGGSDSAGKPSGGGVDVPAGAVAVVAGTAIEQADYDALFAQTKKAYESQGREFPQAGTPEYEQIKTDIVNFLVQREELEKEAAAMSITVTDEEVATRLDELKQQFFQGDETKYQDELKSLGLSEEQLKDQLRASLLNTRLYDEVTKDVKVAPGDAQKYYDEHQDEFTTPEVRDVSHILVKTKAEADEIEKQLADGADFAKLAREKSTDTGSGQNGGNLGEAPREGYVKEFGDAAWALETGQISEPVESQYGWHVIRADGDIKPSQVTPFADAEQSIEDQLLKTEKDSVMQKWIDGIRAKYASQVGYAVGFAPATGGLTTTMPSTGE